jgi:hypothetical protein
LCVLSEQASRSSFFVYVSATLAAAVFVGFAPTFYLRSWFTTSALPSSLVAVHGVVFSLWMVLLGVQVALVRAHRRDLHRKLGVAGAALAALMVSVAIPTPVAQAKRFFAVGFPPAFPPMGVMFALSECGILVFITLVGAALYFRRRVDIHKRLMVLATIEIALAGVDRALQHTPLIAVSQLFGWPGWFTAMFAVGDLFIVAIAVYDRITLGRIHRATLAGGLLIVLSQPLRLIVGATATSDALVRWLAR